MNRKQNKKNLYLHGFAYQLLAYQLLLEYISSRLIIKDFVSTDVMDLYKDYLYYIYSLSQEEKIKNGLTPMPKEMTTFFLQAWMYDRNFMVGLIPKRTFGNILEQILQEKSLHVFRKRSKSVLIQGVGLKSAEGLVFVDNILTNAPTPRISC